MTPTQAAALKKFADYRPRAVWDAKNALSAFLVTLGTSQADIKATLDECKNLHDFSAMQAEASAKLGPQQTGLTANQRSALQKFVAVKDNQDLKVCRAATDELCKDSALAYLRSDCKTVDQFRHSQDRARARLRGEPDPDAPKDSAAKPAAATDARAERAATLAAYRALPCGKARADYLAQHEQEIWQAFREAPLQA